MNSLRSSPQRKSVRSLTPAAGAAGTMASMAARPNKVLVGYDGTEVSRRALDAAASLLGYGSTLAVASVTPKGSHTANVLLSEARERLLRRQLHATYLPLLGDPAEQLLDAAQEVGADLVVIGTRSHNGTPRPALGSVSDDIVRRAPCDVLVVR
jgi:nucleotide-binding universal stress UspA family protein